MKKYYFVFELRWAVSEKTQTELVETTLRSERDDVSSQMVEAARLKVLEKANRPGCRAVFVNVIKTVDC